jgi:hypothetical protein
MHSEGELARLAPMKISAFNAESMQPKSRLIKNSSHPALAIIVASNGRCVHTNDR